MAVHMRNGIRYGGIPNGTVKGTTPSTVPTTVKQLNQIGTVGDIAPVTIPSAVKFSNGNTLETAIGSVATIETSPAVATHAVGDYVFYNGQMYKVIAAIAVGETLTVDTNIEATSVGEELTTLNNGLFTDLGYGLTEYDYFGFTIIRATPSATQIPAGGINLTKAPVSDCFAVVQYYNGSSNVFGTLQAVSSGVLYLLNSSGARVSGSYIEGTLVYPLPH